MVDRPALRRCIDVPTEVFAEKHWGKDALLSRADGLPRDFADLLTLDGVDELLARRGLRTPFLRLVKDGDVVDPKRFTRSGGAGAGTTDQVADDRVAALFADGCTVVLQALHRTWPPLIEFGSRLSLELGQPVQVNAYVTPPASTGFAAHFDVHDVFVLQFTGSKRWRVHAPVHPDPLPDDPWTDHRQAVVARAAEEPQLEIDLTDGDALYLPRGTVHAAQALGEVSGHLTVGVHPATRHTVAEALLKVAARDPRLRASLPIPLDLADREQLAAHIRATAAVLVERLAADSAEVAQAAEVFAGKVLGETRPAPVAPLAQAATLADADPSTVVRLRPGLAHTATVCGERLVLRLPDRTLRLPTVTEAAVRSLLDGTPRRVADLPALDDDHDRVVLVRRLLREGVVVPEVVPEPPADR